MKPFSNPANTNKMKHLKSLNLPLKAAISVSILAALVFRMDQEKFNLVSDIIRHFHASAWIYSTVFMLLQIVLLSFRWEYLINIGQRHLSLKAAIQINLISQLANLIFITSIGGMVARIALSIQHKATLFKSIIATVLDRLLTLSALLLLSACFLPSLSTYVDNKTFHTLSSYVSAFIITVFVFAPLFLNFVIFKMPQASRLKGRMRYGFRYLKVLLKNPLLCIKLIGISMAAQLAFFIGVFALIPSSGAHISFFEMMIVLPMISLVAALPISIGGWGVREGAYVYGLGLLGVPMETAFLISVQVGLIGMLATIAGGLPCLIMSNFQTENLNIPKILSSKFRH